MCQAKAEDTLNSGTIIRAISRPTKCSIIKQSIWKIHPWHMIGNTGYVDISSAEMSWTRGLTTAPVKLRRLNKTQLIMISC